MDALQHHRPTLVQRPLDDGAHADEHVPSLVEEARDRRVVRLRCGRAGLEARVVNGGHELLREERAHRLTDEVGGSDARDAEPVRDLRGYTRLSRACAAADKDDDRQIEGLQLAVTAQPAYRVDTFAHSQNVLRQFLEALEVDRGLAALLEIGLDAERDLPRLHRRQAGRHQRPGQQPLRVRRPPSPPSGR